MSKQLLSILLAFLILAGCNRNHTFSGAIYDPPRPAPAINGINWDGQAFQLEALKGKITLLFFGYTYCPDVCPLTLAELAEMVQEMGEAGKEVAVVFITTDPERDTPERLADYVPVFNPNFYGVQLSLADLEMVKKGYGVYSEKFVELGQTDTTNYLVEHGGLIHVIDREGNLRMAFGYSEPKEKLRADIEYLLAS